MEDPADFWHTGPPVGAFARAVAEMDSSAEIWPFPFPLLTEKEFKEVDTIRYRFVGALMAYILTFSLSEDESLPERLVVNSKVASLPPELQAIWAPRSNSAPTAAENKFIDGAFFIQSMSYWSRTTPRLLHRRIRQHMRALADFCRADGSLDDMGHAEHIDPASQERVLVQFVDFKTRWDRDGGGASGHANMLVYDRWTKVAVWVEPHVRCEQFEAEVVRFRALVYESFREVMGDEWVITDLLAEAPHTEFQGKDCYCFMWAHMITRTIVHLMRHEDLSRMTRDWHMTHLFRKLQLIATPMRLLASMHVHIGKFLVEHYPDRTINAMHSTFVTQLSAPAIYRADKIVHVSSPVHMSRENYHMCGKSLGSLAFGRTRDDELDVHAIGEGGVAREFGGADGADDRDVERMDSVAADDPFIDDPFDLGNGEDGGGGGEGEGGEEDDGREGGLPYHRGFVHSSEEQEAADAELWLMREGIEPGEDTVGHERAIFTHKRTAMQGDPLRFFCQNVMVGDTTVRKFFNSIDVAVPAISELHVRGRDGVQFRSPYVQELNYSGASFDSVPIAFLFHGEVDERWKKEIISTFFRTLRVTHEGLPGSRSGLPHMIEPDKIHLRDHHKYIVSGGRAEDFRVIPLMKVSKEAAEELSDVDKVLDALALQMNNYTRASTSDPRGLQTGEVIPPVRIYGDFEQIDHRLIYNELFVVWLCPNLERAERMFRQARETLLARPSATAKFKSMRVTDEVRQLFGITFDPGEKAGVIVTIHKSLEKVVMEGPKRSMFELCFARDRAFMRIDRRCTPLLVIAIEK